MSEPEIIDATEILGDVQRAAEQITKASITDPEVKKALGSDVYPLLLALTQKVVEHENLLDELAADTEMVSPETAIVVLGALELGEALAVELSALTFKDPTKARRIRDLVLAYRAAAETAKEQIELLAGGEDLDTPEEDAPEGEVDAPSQEVG